MKLKIYSITNKVNDKRYIGITGDLYNRKRAHLWALRNKKHSNIKLQNAWNKYSEDGFEVEVLETFDTNNRDYALSKEVDYIDHYDSFKTGYNMSTGADGNVLNIPSKETIEKRRKLMLGNKHMLGKKHSEETKRKIGNAHRGKHVSESTRELSRQFMTGRFVGEKNPFYGRSHTEETKSLIRKAQGKRVMCIETNKVYDSIKQCAQEMGIPQMRSNINKVCLGKAKTCKGYTFKFV